jgi:pimeloyl-ACP methyl ester carboxylesterase
MELTREWTDTAAGVMHARGGGEGTSGSPVVLVHGMVISSRYMVPTALELAPLCAPSRPPNLSGYGNSAKPRGVLASRCGTNFRVGNPFPSFEANRRETDAHDGVEKSAVAPA